MKTTYAPCIVVFLGAILIRVFDGLPHSLLDHRFKLLHSDVGTTILKMTFKFIKFSTFSKFLSFYSNFINILNKSHPHLFSTLFIIGQFSQFANMSLLAASTSSIFFWT